MKLQNRIAHIRKVRGISQSALAERVGSNLSMIGKLERGDRELTSSWILKICEALECGPSDLFRDENEPVQLATFDRSGNVTRMGFPPTPWQIEIPPGTKIGLFGPKLRSLELAEASVTLPIPQGAKLVVTFYDLHIPPEPGRLCFINVNRPGDDPNDRLFVGTALPGSSPGLYHITPLGGAVITDVPIYWALPIKQIIFP